MFSDNYLRGSPVGAREFMFYYRFNLYRPPSSWTPYGRFYALFSPKTTGILMRPVRCVLSAWWRTWLHFFDYHRVVVSCPFHFRVTYAQDTYFA
jgi:hypothetical protein